MYASYAVKPEETYSSPSGQSGGVYQASTASWVNKIAAAEASSPGAGDVDPII